MDGDDNIIVADTHNHRIRKISPQGHVFTLAGIGKKGHQDGDLINSAQFYLPVGVAVDENGNVLVADTFNHCIRWVASDDVTPLVIGLRLPPLLQSSFASDVHYHLFSTAVYTGCLDDVCFVVEKECLHALRGLLSARCEYFRSMFGAGFKEGDSGEIPIEGTSSAAFKALLKYLYTDNMDEVDDAVLFDLAKNAVARLEQAHTAGGEGPMWVSKLKSRTMRYATRNFEDIRCNATATLVLLAREHPDLLNRIMHIKCGLVYTE
jgi:hypothetical protein